jgi:hypothetical protein
MALASAQNPSRLQLVAGANATFFHFAIVNLSASYRPAARATNQRPTAPANALGGPLPPLAESGPDDGEAVSVPEALREGIPSLEYWLDVNG